MNTYPHDLERLRHYGLRGHAQHAKELRQRRMMVKAGWLLVGALMLVGASRCAHAAPLIQGWSLQYASARASQYDLSLTAQAVLLQESSGCLQLENKSDPSYGCMGLEPATASWIAGKSVTAAQLKADHRLNIRLGVKYLIWCTAVFGWARGLVCYNAGSTAAGRLTDKQAERNRYVKAIKRRMKYIRALPVSQE